MILQVLLRVFLTFERLPAVVGAHIILRARDLRG